MLLWSLLLPHALNLHYCILESQIHRILPNGSGLALTTPFLLHWFRFQAFFLMLLVSLTNTGIVRSHSSCLQLYLFSHSKKHVFISFCSASYFTKPHWKYWAITVPEFRCWAVSKFLSPNNYYFWIPPQSRFQDTDRTQLDPFLWCNRNSLACSW